jgi:hypothetical protein
MVVGRQRAARVTHRQHRDSVFHFSVQEVVSWFNRNRHV